MPEKTEVQIFLAHAREDKELVRQLYRKLKQEGYSPWLDEEDLLPGQLWRKEIPKVIKNSDFFIACLSKQSVAKTGYVQKEFRLALNYCAERPQDNIYLIPLKFNDCEIPNLRQEEYGIALRDYQWLDYYKSDGFSKLVKAIEHQRVKVKSVFPGEILEETRSKLASSQPRKTQKSELEQDALEIFYAIEQKYNFSRFIDIWGMGTQGLFLPEEAWDNLSSDQKEILIRYAQSEKLRAIIVGKQKEPNNIFLDRTVWGS